DKFPEDAAKYAVDHVKADWKKNALESAKTYQKDMNMSTAEIKDQLTSDSGDKFTPEEAQYAVDNLSK
ncbi:Ltp family lipoprotein, partial [Lactobacillus gasseri]|nr:Ltp family lipoprotein [Lactobacillus gasseri]